MNGDAPDEEDAPPPPPAIAAPAERKPDAPRVLPQAGAPTAKKAPPSNRGFGPFGPAKKS